MEDEFQWLEGPYRQNHWTIADLLGRRRSQSRESRRRRGETEFRNDYELDQRDSEGNLLPTFHDCCKKQRSKVLEKEEKHNAAPRLNLCDLCHHEVFSDLMCGSTMTKGLATKYNAVVKNKARSKPTRRSSRKKPRKINRLTVKNDNATMMTREGEHNNENTPLHDLDCVGIDTCSSRSISCDLDDFLDLNIKQKEKKTELLRGVGGTSGVAGKGVLIFYAKDIEGKVKVVIEPNGFYLKDPPARFRIIGQQRFKTKGVSLIQDYDEAGTDILKCKRSGSVLPLKEKCGILLLRTFKYHPNEELKEKLRTYVRKLKESDNFLPHVIDLDEIQCGKETVLIMNEGNLKVENYERLLHWRFGHTSSKVLKAMDLIEKSHLNEDCYCCNQGKFKRAPFPKNEGTFVAVAESYWRIYVDGFGG